MNFVSITDLPWQEPVITEKLASECLQQEPLLDNTLTYLSVPWATLIDSMNAKIPEVADPAKRVFERISKLSEDNYFTVCQHYRFNEIVEVFKSIGGKCIFAPHAIRTNKIGSFVQKATAKIKQERYTDIQPFPLYAPNVPKITKDRPLLYSFVGAYMDHYLSPIRLNIFKDDNHPKNTVIVERKIWQFNDQVYGQQIYRKKTEAVKEYLANEKKKYYIRVLGASRYSLCPSGAGPTSIRVFESLGCGAIPVILADTFELPTLKDVDWNECILRIPENKYHRMRDIIESISTSREREMRQNCLKAYKLLSGKNFVQCIRDYYE